MGVGVVQLVAYGAQDIYLTGNPQISFYKIAYKRYTNFAVESIKQSFVNLPDFGKKSTSIISKNGDLIQQMYLDITLPTGTSIGNTYWTYGIGNALIDTVEMQIGGTTIDTQYGQWLDIWCELTNKPGHRSNYDNMVGNFVGSGNNNGLPTSSSNTTKLYVPLKFWFNKCSGLALPIIALSNQEVRLNISIRPLVDLYIGGTFTKSNTSDLIVDLYVDYVFLDTDERRKFAQGTHEYLIEQIQKTEDLTITSGKTSVLAPIKFYHPVKELIWVIPNKIFNTTYNSITNEYGNRWLDYSNNTDVNSIIPQDTFDTASIEMNGSPRFYKRNAKYFRTVQNYQRHTNSPRVPNTSAFSGLINCNGDTYEMNKYIYTYSFALDPEEHQPTGTCNFSRLNSVNLALNFTGLDVDVLLKIFGVNYNILRFANGQCGVAYSN